MPKNYRVEPGDVGDAGRSLMWNKEIFLYFSWFWSDHFSSCLQGGVVGEKDTDTKVVSLTSPLPGGAAGKTQRVSSAHLLSLL